MSGLVKGALGGAWSLAVGWILPAFLSLQLMTVLVAPALAARVTAIQTFLHEPAGVRQATLLAVAVVAGLVLAACQAPLYRLLEGYALWPPKLAERRIKRHRELRKALMEKQRQVAGTGQGVRSGLLYDRAARYPASDKQFAPTMLGNAIRRFETYAGDRYMLDAVLLWNHLTAAAPKAAVTAVDNARANVDFFICLAYGGAATTMAGAAGSALAGPDVATSLAMGAGIAIAAVCYRLAVLASDEWQAAFRAVVDHGRAGVAAAFGLRIPDSLTEERLMWRAVGTLVRRPYEYSESKQVAELVEHFRQAPGARRARVLDGGTVASPGIAARHGR